MEQFLTGDIWEAVNKRLTKRQKKIACIAYVTLDKLELSKGDTLICDASDFAIKFGETSAEILETYFNKGINVFSNQQLHSKILLTDKFLVIGSANLSKSSAEKLTESSIITDSESLISQAEAFCHNLKEESKLLKKEDIRKLLKIEVVKRPSQPTDKSEVRQKEFGNSYWFTPLILLSNKVWNEIEDFVEKSKYSISKIKKIDENNISVLTVKGSGWITFRKNAKEGDQIIIKLEDYFYPPVTILKKKVDNGYTHFFYKQEEGISLSKFQQSIKKINLENENFSRVRKISENDIKKIRQVWNKSV